MIQEPLAFNSLCSAAILLPWLFCNMCATKATKKPTLCKIRATLQWYEHSLFQEPLIMHQELQIYQHVSSLDYLIYEFGHRCPLILLSMRVQTNKTLIYACFQGQLSAVELSTF